MGSSSSMILRGPCVTGGDTCPTMKQQPDVPPHKTDDNHRIPLASLDVIRQQLNDLKVESYDRIESITDRAERYVRSLQVPIAHLKKMTDSFVHELETGMLAHQRHPYDWDPKECSFKMIDSCVWKLPTGQERGAFYALDFGGSTFRVVRVELNSNGEMKVNKHEEPLFDAVKETRVGSKGLMESRATATQMFDFFATTVKKFMKEQGDIVDDEASAGKEIMAGFTFSFPCTQRNIDHAVLMNWTKGFETGRETDDPVEGLDVVELMNVAFRRNAVPARCNSVLNDTVGTLLSCGYSMNHKNHPPCLVGLIIGTGMNCCYYDEAAPQFGYHGKIINVECGNFNRDLPRINVDSELDFKAIESRGMQQIEKMCSGAYLGEICRLVLVHILAGQTPPRGWEPFSLSTKDIAHIANDKSKELIVAFRVMAESWHAEMPLENLKIIRRVAITVMERSAALAAVLVAGCAKKTGKLQPAFGGVSVGIDGSLYKSNPAYRDCLRHTLNAILGDDIGSLVHLLLADDGSGKGAAVLAATLHDQE